MRRSLPPLLLLLTGVLVGWLLYTELDATGWLRPAGDRARARDRPPTLEADLERRARLRGLPGIERGDPGVGRLVGRVHVYVPGRGGAPLPDVEVAVLGIEGERRVPRETRTDEEGAFSFEALPALVGYALVVQRPPWREIVLRGVNVSRHGTTDVGTLLLGAPTLLRGEVVDAAGRPVAGARAGLFRGGSAGGRLDLRSTLRELESAVEPLAEARTQDDGVFAIADVSPGRYLLRVRAPGYATAFRHDVWVSLDERSPALRVVLDRGAGFYGRVLGPDEHPVAGARVLAVGLGGEAGRGLERAETTSGPDGTYRLDSLVAGERYFLEAWAVGHAPHGLFAVPQEETRRDLVLPPAGRVEGRITTAGDDRGVAGAEVFLVAGAATGLTPVTTVADEEGRYAFETVGPGPVLLFGADAPDRVGRSFSYGVEHAHQVEAGATTRIDLALDVGVEAVGRVFDERGRPVAYASVSFLDPRGSSAGVESALTAADGTWRVGGLRAGTYEVRVQAPGFAPLVTDEEARVEVQGPGPWRRDFVLDRGARIEGRVLDPDGAGVAGARLQVRAEGGRRFGERLGDLVAVSGSTGAYAIQGLPPHAELRLEARHDRWARALSPPIRLAPGAREEVDLVLGPGARVGGRVADANGAAIEGARVRWGRLEGKDDRAARDAFRADQRLGSRVVRTDAAGRFEIDAIEPGRFLLKIEHEGFSPWYRRDLRVAEDGATPFVQATLEASHVVRGRVTDATTGRVVVGAWVYAREHKDAEEESLDPGRVPGLSSAQTGEDGRYEIQGLAPGRVYEVVAWLAPGYRAAVQDRSDERVRRENVRPGDEDVDFALAPDA